MAQTNEPTKLTIVFGTLVNFDEIIKKCGETDRVKFMVQKFQESGLTDLVSTIPDYYDEDTVLHFYKNAKIVKNDKTREDEIRSSFFKRHVVITLRTFNEFFKTPMEGELISDLSTETEVDEEWWKFFSGGKPFDLFGSSFRKNDLLEEYGYLYDIVGKCLEGRMGGHDKGTARMWIIMIAIMKVMKVNWCEFLFDRLMTEVKKESLKKAYGGLLNSLFKKMGISKPTVGKDLQKNRILGVFSASFQSPVDRIRHRRCQHGGGEIIGTICGAGEARA